DLEPRLVLPFGDTGEEAAVDEPVDHAPELPDRDLEIGRKVLDVRGIASAVEPPDELDRLVTRHPAAADILVHVLRDLTEAELEVLDHLVDDDPILVESGDSDGVSDLERVILPDVEPPERREVSVVEEGPVRPAQ